MKKFYETEQFLKLKAKWDKKLKKSGFNDLEQPDGNLKSWASTYFAVRRREEVDEAKQTYYRLAGEFLYEYEFDSKMERRAWEMHSQGVSLREIAKNLKRQGYKTTVTKVIHLIRRLSTTMKEKYFLSQETSYND